MRRQRRLLAQAEEQKKQERRDSYNILQREYYIRGTAIRERAYVSENGLNTTNFVSFGRKQISLVSGAAAR